MTRADQWGRSGGNQPPVAEAPPVGAAFRGRPAAQPLRPLECAFKAIVLDPVPAGSRGTKAGNSSSSDGKNAKTTKITNLVHVEKARVFKTPSKLSSFWFFVESQDVLGTSRFRLQDGKQINTNKSISE